MGLHLVPDAADLRPPRGLPRRRGHLRARGRRPRRAGRRSARPARSSSPTRPTTSARSSRGARASTLAFGAAQRAGCCCRARRFAPTSADPRRALRRTASPMPDVSYTYADAVRDRICRPVTFIPYDGIAPVAQRRRRHRGVLRDALDRSRGGAPLPHGDLDRARRRAAADPRAGARAAGARLRAGGHRDAGGLVVAADAEHARADREGAARGHGRRPAGRAAHRARAAARSLQAFARSPRPRGSSRSTWSARASTSRACASASTRPPRRRR